MVFKLHWKLHYVKTILGMNGKYAFTINYGFTIKYGIILQNIHYVKTIWVCLKIVYPIVPSLVLLIIIPIKWLFHWEYTQHFQTNPY